MLGLGLQFKPTEGLCEELQMPSHQVPPIWKTDMRTRPHSLTHSLAQGPHLADMDRIPLTRCRSTVCVAVQVLALFNKAVRRLTAAIRAIQEEAVEAEVRPGWWCWWRWW